MIRGAKRRARWTIIGRQTCGSLLRLRGLHLTFVFGHLNTQAELADVGDRGSGGGVEGRCPTRVDAMPIAEGGDTSALAAGLAPAAATTVAAASAHPLAASPSQDDGAGAVQGPAGSASDETRPGASMGIISSC